MNKRWVLTAVLAVCLCVICAAWLPLEAQAEEIASGSCGYTLDWVLDSDGTLTVSGNGDMTDEEEWADYKTQIKAVVLEEGVESICNGAFSGCTNLVSITIPTTLKYIWLNPFQNCDNLQNVYISDLAAWCGIGFGSNPLYYAENLYVNGELVTELVIPDGVTEIKNEAFRRWTGVTSVTIPDSVTTIGGYAFEKCSGLTSVTMGNGVTTLGSSVFAECTSLKNVTLSANLSSISFGAFNGCTALTHIDIPASVTSFGTLAFSKCTALSGITIPGAVSKISNDTFSHCLSLSDIKVDPQNQHYCVDDRGVLLNAGKTELIFVPYSLSGSYEIPHGVTKLGTVFRYCSELSSIVIHENVTQIGIAFQESAKLNHILYKGTEAQWNEIKITNTNNSNAVFLAATRHYNCTGREIVDGVCSLCSTPCTHSWDGGKVTKEPTCAEEGVKTFTCDRCGSTRTEAIAKTAEHTYGAWAKVDDNTHKHTCSVCGKEEAVTHAWDGGKVTKEPTCEEEGAKTYTCACGHSYTKNEVAALGHKWVDATCDKAKTCSVCGKTEGAALGHKWQDATCEKAKTCSVCNKTEGSAKGHAWDAGTVTKPATEAAEGEMTYKCTACGQTKTERIPKLDHTHKYNKETVQPTCEAKGYDKYTCACGHSYIENEVAALGHKWQDATCEKAKTCATCGKTEGAALGHKWVDATCEAPKTCSACGKTEGAAKGHAWDAGTVTKPATEAAEGEKTYKCTACGQTRTESIPKLDHTHKYNKETVQPTCEAKGYDKYTCACGHSYIENEVAALGHKWTDATCEKAQTCTSCGKVNTDASGHVWQFAEGEAVATCTICSKKETDLAAHVLKDNYCKSCDLYMGACGEQVYWLLRKDGSMLIFGQGTLFEYDAVMGINPPWFNVMDRIKAVEILDGVTNLIPGMFNGSQNLTDVIIADSVTDIASYALGWCKALKNVRLPASLTKMGSDVLIGCDSLEFISYVCGTPLFNTEIPGEPVLEERHRETTQVVTEPTCGAGGYTTYTCVGCGHTYRDDVVPATGAHTWTDATCEAPKTCSVCGKTEGTALDHMWQDATCEKPKTCMRCNKTEGKPVAHAYTDGVCIWCGKEEQRYVPGDVNGDGKINVTDAMVALRYAVKKITKDELNVEAADVNSDGKVNVTDAMQILRYAVKKISEFKPAV